MKKPAESPLVIFQHCSALHVDALEVTGI